MFTEFLIFKLFRLETNRYHFFDTDTDIFKTFFTNFWLVADIQLSTDTLFGYLKYFG